MLMEWRWHKTFSGASQVKQRCSDLLNTWCRWELVLKHATLFGCEVPAMFCERQNFPCLPVSMEGEYTMTQISLFGWTHPLSNTGTFIISCSAESSACLTGTPPHTRCFMMMKCSQKTQSRLEFLTLWIWILKKKKKRCFEFLERDPKQRVRIVGLSCINLDRAFLLICHLKIPQPH